MSILSRISLSLGRVVELQSSLWFHVVVQIRVGKLMKMKMQARQARQAKRRLDVKLPCTSSYSKLVWFK